MSAAVGILRTFAALQFMNAGGALAQATRHIEAAEGERGRAEHVEALRRRLRGTPEGTDAESAARSMAERFATGQWDDEPETGRERLAQAYPPEARRKLLVFGASTVLGIVLLRIATVVTR